MCWSGEASAALATAGLAGTAYFYKKGEPPELCAALGYFAAMEALQAYTYTVINDCASTGNQVATVLGYVHIAFQPIFLNAVSMHFIPAEVRKKISAYVYGLCLLGAIFFLLRLYPFTWTTPCWEVNYTIPFCSSTPHIPFCGPKICSSSGSWHIAWAIPARFNYFFDNSYLFVGFILPILYGSWRMTLYHIITGPFLAFLTTNNANEWAAVWCLYSIALLGLMIKSPIRKLLYVRRWFWWTALLKKQTRRPKARKSR